ncbi:uncharacterized protein LOC119357365 [Triticum dicoccoides]|uniref:uncharacterized protein LOC119357365 n=1 Tax=Triticum dicoccoides TaxID=85692 RepID=UPI0018900476|nr:uncharacterized protein LOC119357365 [Triticum dicoccoides]
MQGGCIADIGSCGTGFDSASDSVRTKKFRTKGLELADRKGEKNKAMPRAPSICCSSIDEALSFSSRARCNKRLLSWSLDMMSSATLLGGYSPPSQSPPRSAESDQWLSLPNPPSVYKTRSLSVTGSPAAAS